MDLSPTWFEFQYFCLSTYKSFNGDPLAGLTDVVTVDTVEDLCGRHHLVEADLGQKQHNFNKGQTGHFQQRYFQQTNKPDILEQLVVCW